MTGSQSGARHVDFQNLSDMFSSSTAVKHYKKSNSANWLDMLGH